MIAVIDYGVGNLFSLVSSLKKTDAEVLVTNDGEAIARCDKIILPGVGAFGDAAALLRSSGMDSVLLREAEKGKQIMGICLGMQLLFEKSYEYGEHRGLGLLRGEVVPMQGTIPEGLKIPHIGWNALHITKPCSLLKNSRENDFVYFVHSYHAVGCGDSLAATAEYGIALTALVQKDNIMGCQFHPEKSGAAGLAILRAFCGGRA